MIFNLLTFSIILFPVLILLGLLIFSGFVILEQKKAMVVERWGQYHHTLSSGVKFIIPFIERVKYIEEDLGENVSEGDYSSKVEKRRKRKIDLREKALISRICQVSTKDNIFIRMNLNLHFKITAPEKLVYQVENFSLSLENLIEAKLRQVVDEVTLKEILQLRNEIKKQLIKKITEVFTLWGLKLLQLDINELLPPESIRKTMQEAINAESDRATTLLMAEAEKKARLLRAEISKEESLRSAEAEAARIELINKQLANKSKEVVNYYITTNYLDTFKQISAGDKSKIIYFPYEGSSIFSIIETLKDFFKFQKDRKEASGKVGEVGEEN